VAAVVVAAVVVVLHWMAKCEYAQRFPPGSVPPKTNENFLNRNP
jgi:hypothetical protein